MFQIGDAKKAVTKVANAPDATLTLAQTVLRTVVGQNDLKTLQNEQRGVNKKLKTAMEKVTREWGVNIKSMEIKTLTEAGSQTEKQLAATAESKVEPGAGAG
jgi:regulator of protease activity HflC (stomatin/prohibitin superfamily)